MGNNILQDTSKKIHMIGIGGVSMSGIADIIMSMGFKVTGSDMVESANTDRLEKQGIHVVIGHKAENVHGSDIVVYTAAVKEDNPEFVEAKRLGIELIERSSFLGLLTKLYPETISISGTHGKTTTTSMLSQIFIDAGKDPTIQVGADLKILDNQNYRVGKSDYFIVESCEYVRSFLKFFPKTAVVLNIEADHLDCYKDIDDIKSAFNTFINIPNEEGLILLNADDKNCMDISKNHKAKLMTFGIENKYADWIAKDIKLNKNGGYSFTAISNGEKIDITLNVPGHHNVYNALASTAIARSYNISEDIIKQALSEFRGASRRFEYVGTVNGASIYDDYAHHPTEIKATISSARNMQYHKLWVVFQPHTYTRTYTLFDEFVKAFKDADNVIITDIYAAREKDTGLVSAKQLADKVNEFSKNCIYLSTLEECKDYLLAHITDDDIVLTVGAGTITKLGRMLLK